MTGRPDNNPWYDSLPESLSEEFIMDWVDGRVPEHEAAALARAAGRTDIIEHVAAMKVNRSIMATMGQMDLRGLDPQELAARLSRETPAHAADAFPTFKFEAHTSVPSRAVKPRLSPWPLAMAAGVTLAVFIALSTSRQAPTKLAPGGFTIAAERSQETTVATSTAASDATEPTNDRPIAIASHAAAVEPISRELASRLVIDSDRAIELAREGRLLVRVAASESGLISTPLDSLVSGDFNWRISDEVSRSMIAAVSPYFGADSGVMAASEVGPNEGRFLTAEMFGPPQGMNEPHTALASAAATTRSTTYLLHVNNEARALDGLKHAINARYGANVLFEELPRGLDDLSGNEAELYVPLIIEQR